MIGGNVNDSHKLELLGRIAVALEKLAEQGQKQLEFSERQEEISKRHEEFVKLNVIQSQQMLANQEKMTDKIIGY